jgi:hypothetical protein
MSIDDPRSSNAISNLFASTAGGSTSGMAPAVSQATIGISRHLGFASMHANANQRPQSASVGFQ